MTHDELLEEVNKYCEAIVSGQVWTTDIFIKSLRAVVELHKPMLWKNLGNDTDGYKCEVCKGNSYPCITIKAIEKELR
jgi:hypothetical protein